MDRVIEFRRPYFKGDKFSHFGYWGEGDNSLVSLTRYFPSEDDQQYTEMRDIKYNTLFAGDILHMNEESVLCPNENVVIEYYFGVANIKPCDSRFFAGTLHEACRSHLGGSKPKDGVSGVRIGNFHETTGLVGFW